MISVNNRKIEAFERVWLSSVGRQFDDAIEYRLTSGLIVNEMRACPVHGRAQTYETTPQPYC